VRSDLATGEHPRTSSTQLHLPAASARRIEDRAIAVRIDSLEWDNGYKIEHFVRFLGKYRIFICSM